MHFSHNMKPIYRTFSFEKSLDSVERTLDKENTWVLERDNLSDSDEEIEGKVIFAYCTVIYIDLRVKQDLTDLPKRILYGKEYQCIINQVCSLLGSIKLCHEVKVNENKIYGIFDTRYKYNIDDIIALVAKLNSLLKAINFKFSTRNFPTIKWGIGVDYNRISLFTVLEEGNAKIWTGPALQTAKRLASYGNMGYLDKTIMISDLLFTNMNPDNRELFKINEEHDCYHGNIVDIEMEEWLKKNNV